MKKRLVYNMKQYRFQMFQEYQTYRTLYIKDLLSVGITHIWISSHCYSPIINATNSENKEQLQTYTHIKYMSVDRIYRHSMTNVSVQFEMKI